MTKLVSFSPKFLDFDFFFRLVEYVFRRSVVAARVVSINIILNQLFKLFEPIFGLILYFRLPFSIFDLIFYHLDILSATERHTSFSSTFFYKNKMFF